MAAFGPKQTLYVGCLKGQRENRYWLVRFAPHSIGRPERNMFVRPPQFRGLSTRRSYRRGCLLD